MDGLIGGCMYGWMDLSMRVESLESLCVVFDLEVDEMKFVAACEFEVCKLEVCRLKVYKLEVCELEICELEVCDLEVCIYVWMDGWVDEIVDEWVEG